MVVNAGGQVMGGSSRSDFRNWVELAAFRTARATIGRGGPGLIEPAGTAIGSLFHLMSGRRRQIIRFNLSLAFPNLTQKERDKLALRVGQNFGRAMMGALRLQRMTPEKLVRLVSVEGREHLDWVAQEGRGAFFLSAHLGSWELAALYVGLDLPGGIGVVHRPLDNPLLDFELQAFRQRFGNRALGKDAALRLMLGEIKAGRAVGILIDQKTRAQDGGIDVPFFGHPAKTHSILARIALKTGTPVIPTFAFLESGGRFTLSFSPPVVIESGDDVFSLTARYTLAIETAIRRRPDQWLWYHDRWRDLRLASSSTD